MRRKLSSICSRGFTFVLIFLPRLAAAQGLGGAGEINLPGGGGEAEVRATIRSLLIRAVSFVGLLAVVMIIIAGIMLVIYGADDTKRETAKKMIIYTIVGVLVIALASALVLFLSTLIG